MYRLYHPACLSGRKIQVVKVVGVGSNRPIARIVGVVATLQPSPHCTRNFVEPDAADESGGARRQLQVASISQPMLLA